jgi:hypothetical protein
MMRFQDTTPTPTPAPEGGSDSTADILQSIIDLYDKEPGLVFALSLVTAVSIAIVLAGIVYAISKAGHFQPPRVVLSVITGLVGMLAIIAVIVRPGVEALGVAVGTAIGGLVGALGTAYSEHRKDDDGNGGPDSAGPMDSGPDLAGDIGGPATDGGAGGGPG